MSLGCFFVWQSFRTLSSSAPYISIIWDANFGKRSFNLRPSLHVGFVNLFGMNTSWEIAWIPTNPVDPTIEKHDPRFWGRNHTRQTRRFIWKKAREVSVRDPKIYTFGRARNGIGWHKKYKKRTMEMGRNGLLPNFYTMNCWIPILVSWCLFDNWTRYI